MVSVPFDLFLFISLVLDKFAEVTHFLDHKITRVLKRLSHFLYVYFI